MDFDAKTFEAEADRLFAEMGPFFVEHDDGELLDAIEEAAEAAGGDRDEVAEAFIEAIDEAAPRFAAGANRQIMFDRLKKQAEKKRSDKKQQRPGYGASKRNEALDAAVTAVIKRLAS